MATSKDTAKKTVAKKPAAPKKAAPKASAAKKPAAKKASTKAASSVSPFERYKMIEVAAYYKAEKDSFKKHAVDYWIAAEKEIGKKLDKK